jgi:hypothetical protein
MVERLKVAFLAIALFLGACVNPTITPIVTALPPTVTPTINPTVTALPIILSDHFVSPTGDDNNPGTEALPWRTIQKAVNLAQPSETIFVRGGTYYESIQILQSGKNGLPITLTSYPGEIAEINGDGNLALYSSGPVSYWIIENLTLRSSNTHTVRFGWFHEAVTSYLTLRNNYIFGAVFTVGNHQLFENNEINGSGYTDSGGYGGINDSHGGFGDDATHHNVYRNNYIHDFTNYNARGIWTQGRTHDNLIEGNRIENIWTTGLGQCLDLDAGKSGLVQWRQIVRNNRIKDCSYAGIQLENVFEGLVENNIIRAEKGGSAGVIVINYSPTIGCGVGGENNQYGDTNGDNSCLGDLTNTVIRQNLITKNGAWDWGYGGVLNWGAGGLKILGNTIYASDSAGNAAINFQAPTAETSQAIIQNNILENGNGPAICAHSFDSFALDQHNLMFKTNFDTIYGLGTGCTETYSLADYQRATGQGVNSIQADPQFENPASGDFHLLSTSPAIDQGLSLGLATDLDGMPRPLGAGWEMGVYEYQPK